MNNNGTKKHVQFDLQLKKQADEFYEHGNASDNGEEEETSDNEEDDTTTEEGDDFDEVEKSLMQGYSEYDVAANAGQPGKPQFDGRKKPDLRLDFGSFSSGRSTGLFGLGGGRTRGGREAIDAELPLDQQTYVVFVLIMWTLLGRVCVCVCVCVLDT